MLTAPYRQLKHRARRGGGFLLALAGVFDAADVSLRRQVGPSRRSQPQHSPPYGEGEREGAAGGAARVQQPSQGDMW